MLTSGQRRALRGLVAEPTTPHRVAHRARMVLEADAGSGSVDRTARTWVRRYLEHGASGLEDAPRSGRPSAVTDHTVRRVLTRTLYTPTPRWTSHTIAEASGISQSAVVRLWARVFDWQALSDAGPWIGWDRTHRPAGLYLSARTAAIVLAGPPPTHPTHRRKPRGVPSAGFSMRSPMRAPLQTILAAELLTDEVPAGRIGPAFLRSATPDPGDHYALVHRTPVDDEIRALVETDERIELVEVGEHHWQALLPHFGAAMDPAALPALEDLAHRVREWAQRPTSEFCWTAPAPQRTPTVRTSHSIPRHSYLSESQRLAESVAAAIQDGVNAGRLVGGERVTEPFLMRATHASRSQVRDALRSLASDGLVELRTGRGAVVPTPTVEDVHETYSIRRALGHLVVGSAANWQPGDLEPASIAFDNLLRVAGQGDVRATDDADLDFQDALAACVRLRRVPTMFRRITMQLRLFISVMGLDYAYSIDDIVTDDSAILDAVRDRDPAAAQELWKQKMDAAVRYMVRQLGPGG